VARLPQVPGGVVVSGALSATSATLLEMARAGRPRPAIVVAQDLVRRGLSFERLVDDLLVPVMREVGRLWQEHHWSVADEHAATAVVDGVLGALALDIPEPRVPKGEVLVACVEQEYHSLPARLGVELLRHAGWSVTFLGASVPAQDLQLYAVTAAPDVVVLSCTIVEHLAGARRGVAAIADLGLPAVVAGAAVGTDARADWLGASAWIGPTAAPTDGSPALCQSPADATTASPRPSHSSSRRRRSQPRAWTFSSGRSRR
jgi:methanogenic corrinoid protein MtbC1